MYFVARSYLFTHWVVETIPFLLIHLTELPVRALVAQRSFSRWGRLAVYYADKDLPWITVGAVLGESYVPSTIKASFVELK